MSESIHRFSRLIRSFGLFALVGIILGSTSLPMTALADGSTDCPPGSTPVTATSGTTQPSGADASTYTYDKCTGLWTNKYYSWSPATKITTPGSWYVTQTFTCQASNGQWTGRTWVWSPVKGDWYQQTVTLNSPPSGATNLVACPPAQQVTDPGPGSTNTSTSSTSSGTSVNDSNSATLNNTLTSTAGTGNASVIGNTTGGSATSGTAQAIANVINAVQSSSSLGAGTLTFEANINGDVNGNLIIDPSAIQPASSTTPLNGTTPSGLALNVTTNEAINNNINLAAASGDATVSKNTSAGSATSGNAQAVANVVNLLNSLVSSKQSFVGVININGNFKGNILVPQNFLDTLLASNAPHQTISLPTASLTTTVNNNQTITNNINSMATSGTATVADNTGAGSATSGSAKTNVTLFDLTGDHVLASNTMLVFVNVLGKWVGVIMNAPVGTTAAALGGYVTANTPAVLAANVTNNQTINNNINVAATTGDATVDRNTSAGNATSGNAATAVNLLNIANSDFSLSGWFGILFINVFGNWYGSFGVAPPPVKTIPKSGTSSSMPSQHQTFKFVPTSSSGGSVTHTSSSSAASQNGDIQLSATLVNSLHHVLGASTAHVTRDITQTSANNNVTLLWGAGIFLAGALMLFGERRHYHRLNRQA
jgi:hypothetical protein